MEEMEKLVDGPKLVEKGDHEQLVTRLRDAASKITDWSYSSERENTNIRNKEVTLAEMAAMYRLKTLISISAGLVDVITRAMTWTKENVTLIESCRASDVLPMALAMFEATSAIAEIFQLKSIDRSAAKVLDLT
uniref:Lyase_1 domain-containing protein n=1 Tax=Angiostrongylus cantonensis TaxID=6313 RepID=A0A0K0D913_ANGCA